MKILLILLSSIGDCVMASSVVAALLDRCPGAHLTCVVQSKSAAAVRNLLGLSEVLEWDESQRSSLRRILQTLWSGKYDAALDLRGLDKAALFMLASRAKTRLAGATSRPITRLISTPCVPEAAQTRARNYTFGRAVSLGIASDANRKLFLSLPVFASHHEAAACWMSEQGLEAQYRLSGLNLGASYDQSAGPPTISCASLTFYRKRRNHTHRRIWRSRLCAFVSTIRGRLPPPSKRISGPDKPSLRRSGLRLILSQPGGESARAPVM